LSSWHFPFPRTTFAPACAPIAATHRDMGRLGPTEIILIVALILLMFGGKKIPELMRGLGKGMKEFKDAQKEDGPPTSNP